MTVGIVILAHGDLDRVEEIARHWVAGGCPVVIHFDKKVSNGAIADFKTAIQDVDRIRLSKRHRCEWGMWGLVAATQDACELMLSDFEDVRHVFLSSGSCVPLRPVQELVDYLDANPDTDYIESATTSEVSWAIDGLEKERFTLRFPFSWRKQRRLFDRYVEFQRRIGMKRKVPAGLTPHIGSQWWCLTRQTLSAILHDPLRPAYDRYFRRVWIPDESYFQTLARISSRKIQSRSLTLSKFDFQGKPHIFYDDHLQLLRRSDCFVARKIWPRADRLFDAFLRTPESALKQAEPQPSKIDRLFSRATDRRTRGRPGLSMQSRFPNESWENGLTAQPYTVLEGFDDLFEDFQPWLRRQVSATVHSHLFAPDRVQFEGSEN
ncbi:MAG: beta-1,6-N-acetylglucosaminyltransferase, partial [Pseudomonadota bacterium]